MYPINEILWTGLRVGNMWWLNYCMTMNVISLVLWCLMESRDLLWIYIAMPHLSMCNGSRASQSKIAVEGNSCTVHNETILAGEKFWAGDIFFDVFEMITVHQYSPSTIRNCRCPGYHYTCIPCRYQYDSAAHATKIALLLSRRCHHKVSAKVIN